MHEMQTIVTDVSLSVCLSVCHVAELCVVQGTLCYMEVLNRRREGEGTRF